jgi:hypothetical protein
MNKYFVCHCAFYFFNIWTLISRNFKYFSPKNLNLRLGSILFYIYGETDNFNASIIQWKPLPVPTSWIQSVHNFEESFVVVGKHRSISV